MFGIRPVSDSYNLSSKINYLCVFVFQGRSGAGASQDVAMAAGSVRQTAVVFFDSVCSGESSGSRGYSVLRDVLNIGLEKVD